LEEALDLSSDRILNDDDMSSQTFDSSRESKSDLSLLKRDEVSKDSTKQKIRIA
jgi:hypothetical protein